MAFVAFRGLSFQAAPLWDADGLLAPNFILTGDLARAGQLPHWDPWTDAGVPIGTDFSARSPLFIFAAMVLPPIEWSYRLFVWVCWVFGALGMWPLSRRLGAGAPISAIATLALFGSGFMTAHVSQPPLFIPIVWVPWVLLIIETGFRDKTLKSGFYAGALLGFVALMSYPGILPLVCLVIAAWALLRALCPPIYPTEETSNLKRLGFVAAAGAIAAAIFLIVIAPSLMSYLHDTDGYTIRSGALDRETAVMSNRFTLQALASVLSPSIPVASKASRLPDWSITDITGIAGYLCPVLLLLLLAGLFHTKRKALALALVGLACLGLMTAMPDYFPFRGWLYDYCPPFRYFRHPSLFVSIYALLLCLALPIASVSGPIPSNHRRLFPIVFALLALIWAWSLWSVLTHLQAPQSYFIKALVTFAIIWSLAALGWYFRSALSPRWQYAAALLLVIAAAVDTLYHFDAMDRVMLTRSPKAVAQWTAVQKSHTPSLDLASHTGLKRGLMFGQSREPNSKNLVIKAPVLMGYTPINNPIYDQIVALASMQQALTSGDRIFFAPDPLVIDSSSPEPREAWLSRIEQSQTNAPPGIPALIAQGSDIHSLPPPSPLQSDIPRALPIPVELLEYTPTTLSLRINCPAPGWVFITDRWAPGWRATCNGSPIPIRPGLFVFRAINVEKGENLLEMRYQSFGHPGLTWLSWSCLALAAVCALYSSLHRALSSRPPTPASPAD